MEIDEPAEVIVRLTSHSTCVEVLVRYKEDNTELEHVFRARFIKRLTIQDDRE
jgi:hypothetical protein